MPATKDKDFEYDVFLSYASEDEGFSDKLAQRMQHEGIRVWFKKIKIIPGKNSNAKINDPLSKSRKIIVILSRYYFSGNKEWSLLEKFIQSNVDFRSSERYLIPILMDDHFM
ncbi:MAG: toll/interleukin-1 receptor domain-containing protein [bacterium]